MAQGFGPPHQARERGGVSWEWKPGDLAVCVDASDRHGENAAITPWSVRYRGIYKVVGVRIVSDCMGDFLALDLAEDPDAFNPVSAWEADRFRKLEAAEPAFTKAMRELRPLEAA